MSDTPVDNNLLVGNLALQMDFIDREQLIAAMHAWMSEKSKPLADILVEQAALSPDTHELLMALVKKHVELHAGDPSQSLATIDFSPEITQDLANLGDDEVYRTLNIASKHMPPVESEDDPNSTALYFPKGSDSAIRFRVLRSHDKGGLGEVSVAVDKELNREVALKEIRSSYAHDEQARERFTLEAEITGGLEHPGIVPVYGFGHYVDGRPFYAMRFIRGDNLDHAIRRFHDPDRADIDAGARAIEFRRLLGHLVDVCHAIQYAHCRGVLHRDLKPANIMLGKYGETLVVDWGLARTSLHPESPPLTNEPPLQPVYSSGTDHTRQGTQIGTPAFMPPEQAAGRQDKVDARSDVYSLGVTLYELLVGQRAFAEETVDTILTKVRRGDFPHPTKMRPDTPRSLEAVCLKAMAFEPENRYESAAALAEDLEHWLADEPVSAWREPASLRMRRWVKRHRTLVASTAAALIAALLILSVSVGLLNVAKNREARERLRAEQNLELAKQAVDTMLTEVASEELENIPQMEATRSKLLAKASDFYGKFREQTPHDEALRLETALANKRLGDIFRLMGKVAESQQTYATAIELLEKLHQEFPDQPKYQQQLANTNNFLGVLYKKFDRAKALATYDLTVHLQSDLVDKHPQNPSYRQELARSHYNRGILHTTDASAGAEAEADFNKAIGHLRWVLDNNRTGVDIPGCRQELARGYSNLAILHRSRGKLEQARENYELAIATAEPLVEEFPTQRKYQEELALYYNNLSNLLIAQGDEPSLRTAQLANAQSLRLYERAAAAIPEVRSNLGNIHHSRGVLLAKQEQREPARDEFRLAREVLEPLVQEFPDFPEYSDRLGNALYELAKLEYATALEHTQADQLESAHQALQDALNLVSEAARHHQRIVDRYAQDTACRAHLVSDYFLKAWTVKQLKLTSSDSLEHATFRETATALSQLSPDKSEHLKLAAELFAVGAELVTQNPRLGASEQTALKKDFADKGIEQLRAAIEHGLGDSAELRSELQQAAEPDSLFHGLQDHKRLKELIDSLAP
ncbi:MAG: protein kinase domain-containing protein [Bythopirellula sp.]